MVLMFTTVSIQSFEHSKRKSNIQQLSVIIKLDVKSTVGKVGVLQRGQKTPGVEQEHFHSISQAAHSRVFTEEQSEEASPVSGLEPVLCASAMTWSWAPDCRHLEKIWLARAHRRSAFSGLSLPPRWALTRWRPPPSVRSGDECTESWVWSSERRPGCWCKEILWLDCERAH